MPSPRSIKALRPWLAEHPRGRLMELYQAFEGFGVREINRILDYLIRRGELTESGDCNYLYRPERAGRAALQGRIWAVVRGLGQARPAIRPAETARLAEASPDYTGRYLAWLAGQGHLVARRGGYGLAPGAPLEAPRWNRRAEEMMQR